MSATVLADAATSENAALAAFGLDGFPFEIAVLALFGIVLVRAQATYWVGRAAATGANLWAPVRRFTESGATVRAISWIHRWGGIVVTLSFLTIGLQTVINAAAGVVRMPWLRYTLFMLPGCVAWAFIYATIGFAAFLALSAVAAGSPWGIAAIVVLVGALAAWVWWRRQQRAHTDGGAPADTGEAA